MRREELNMHRLAIPFVALLIVAASAEFAVARDGCGRGFYWDGSRCAPMGRYYRDYRYSKYGYGKGYYGRGYGGWGYGGFAPCVHGWFCKPYRGY